MSVTFIKLTVSTLLVVGVVWLAGGAEVLAHLRGVSLAWLVAAIAALTLATFAMAHRWLVVARHLGLHLNYPDAVREYYIGTLINQVLPGGVTGDIARALRARHGADLPTAALSVALERFLGQFALLAVLAAGFAGALALPGGMPWPAWAWAFPIVFLAALTAALLFRSGRSAPARFVSQAVTLQQKTSLIANGAVTSLCLIFGFYACARAAGVSLPAQAWATLIPLILTAMLIPLSVGGWGWREGAAALLFPIIGASPGAGVAAGITYGAAILIAALPAAFLILTARTPKPLSTDRG